MRPIDRIKWKIYYADFTYSNRNGSWVNAPVSGVLFVVEFTRHSKEVHMGMDYYYMDPTPNGDIGDFLEAEKDDYAHLPTSSIKIGNWVSEEVWSNVHEKIFGNI